MGYSVGDKVRLTKAESFYMQGLIKEKGTIVDIAENTPFPYKVVFNSVASKPIRWCSASELELV